MSQELFPPLSQGGGFTQIASGTLVVGTNTFSISYIPTGYKNLYLELYGVISSASTQCNMRFNDDTGNNYKRMTINGAAVGTSAAGNAIDYATGAGNSPLAFTSIEILDYTGTNHNKVTKHTSAGLTVQDIYLTTGLWTSTAVINKITINTTTGTFSGGSYKLYGVK